jgi:hypothetical protein
MAPKEDATDPTEDAEDDEDDDKRLVLWGVGDDGGDG